MGTKLFELFITGIPQGFAFFLLYFSLLNIKIDKIVLYISKYIFAVLAFIIRPYVNFEFILVIVMIVMVVIAVAWRKANIVLSVIYAIITFIAAYL